MRLTYKRHDLFCQYTKSCFIANFAINHQNSTLYQTSVSGVVLVALKTKIPFLQIQITYILLFVNSFIALGSDYIIELCKCYLRPTAVFLDVRGDAAPFYQHMKTQPRTCLGWMQKVGHFYAKIKCEDLLQPEVSHFRIVLLQMLKLKSQSCIQMKSGDCKKKSKNTCTDIELSSHLQHYIMPFGHYTTPGFFSSSFMSWRKATVWKSMNWDKRWYFVQEMYILACECNSLLCEEIQYSGLNI